MRRTRAVGWAYGLTWGRQALQAMTTVVLASIVGPTEFGVMALALIYIGLIELVLQQGFVAAIIQRKVLRQVHVTSVFWLLIASSVVLAAIGVVLGDRWASANGSAELAAVIPVISLSIPLVAVGMVPTALLTRHFRIRALAIRSIGSAAVSSAVAIPMGLAGFGVWALVTMHLSYTLASTVLVVRAARWRPRLVFDWAGVRSLLGFSVANFAARAGNYLVSQTDALVIGLVAGPAAVGLYRLAARFVSMALDVLSGPLQFVSFPDFAKQQRNAERFGQSLVTYVRSAALVTWPALAAVAVAGPYIPRVLGSEWQGVEQALIPLAAYGAIHTVTQFLGPLLQAVGRPGALAALVCVQGVLGAVVYWYVGTAATGGDTATQAASIGGAKVILFLLVPLPALLVAARHLLRMPVLRLARAVLPASVCAVCLYAAGAVMTARVQGFGWTTPVELACVLSAQALAWAVGVFAFSPDIRRMAASRFKTFAPRLAARLT